jgi:hypothetical protein
MTRERATAARSWLLGLLFSLPLLHVACAKTSIAGLSGTGAQAVEHAMLKIGDQQFRFDTCKSGDLEHFLGVDLIDGQGGAIVRVVMDPIDGPRLRIVYGAGGSRHRVDLAPGRCGQLDADARPTNWIVNDVRDVSGFVDVECAAGPGPAISLHVRFSHCH